ncbi:hypothetical protein TNIN_386371 [Trichonephila inaurata madagascariensis]|uniref:Uncharacterized protein n=1 Tax=Trichonephila inaurata madagascariensis TaxID=2747483 RepID=A0A8X6XBS7_9ARAC|nr:hypothetical protein TNIN_386371 [Trichonephila inaurata madagascariensis]
MLVKSMQEAERVSQFRSKTTFKTFSKQNSFITLSYYKVPYFPSVYKAINIHVPLNQGSRQFPRCNYNEGLCTSIQRVCDINHGMVLLLALDLSVKTTENFEIASILK